METSCAAIMDSLSFEDLLRGLAAKYETLRRKNAVLSSAAPFALGVAPLQRPDSGIVTFSTPTSIAPAPMRVGTVSNRSAASDCFWSLPARYEESPELDKAGCAPCNLIALPSRKVEPLVPPADTNEHNLCSKGGSKEVQIADPATSTWQVDRRPLPSTTELSRHHGHFRRLCAGRGAGTLPAPRCLEIMQTVQACGLFPYPLPSVEQLADAILRFSSDEKCHPGQSERLCQSRVPDQRIPQEIGLDISNFVRLMSQQRQSVIDLHQPPALIFQLREALRSEYKYHETRISITLLPAKSEHDSKKKNMLDVISASVIMLNALVIGLSSDVEPDSDAWWYTEIACTVFFTAELIYNMRLSGCLRFFRGKQWAWNNFDFVVVFIALFDLVFTAAFRIVGPTGPGGPDTSSFTIIKMARLGRLARLVRVLRFQLFRELRSMIEGVLAGLRVLFWAIVLLFFFVYLVGIFMRKTVGDAEHPDHEYARHRSFETVPVAMFTLFRCFTDGCTAYDGTPLQTHLYEYYGLPFMFGYMLMYLFVTIGIFNLIMAIFIDNVMDDSHQRKKEELGANSEHMQHRLKELVMSLTSQIRSANAAEAEHGLAQDEDVVISKEVFEAWLSMPEMRQMLHDLEISFGSEAELFDVLDCDLSGELEVAELVEGLMKLRGPTDKCDAVASLLGIRYVTKIIEDISGILHRNVRLLD